MFKTILNSIKTPKRYYKDTLNVFLIRKTLMTTESFNYRIDLLFKMEILLLNM